MCPTTLILLLLLLLTTTATSLSSGEAAITIGATYTSGVGIPPLSLSAVTALGLDSVHIIDPDPNTVRAFLYSNATLILTLPERLIPSVAANRSAASDWLSAVVLPFFPRAKITAISAGDASHAFSLPAARNLRLAVSDLAIRGVKVSASFSASAILSPSSFFPPSAAVLRRPDTVSPMLRFLAETGSPLMISLHPYHFFRARPEIPLGFALFQDGPFNFRDDPASGIRYRNVFDAMTAAVSAALAAAGHGGLPIVVVETGWPTGSDDAAEVDANAAYAQLYVKGLVRHLRFGGGAAVTAVYVYELFDGGGGDGGNRSWGILDRNMSSKYEVDFSGARPTFLVGCSCFLFCVFHFLFLLLL